MILLDIEPYVLNRIETEYPVSLKAQYPDIKFTTSSRDLATTRFPLVYIHLASSPEIGGDLSGDSLNGINATIDISVYDNHSQTRAKAVISQVISIMKSMKFRVIEIPYNDNTDSTFRCIARCRRVIGANETL